MRISDWSSDVCSSDLEMRTQLLPERRRNAVNSTLAELIARLDVVDHQQRSDVGFPRIQLRQDLARKTFDDRVLLPLRAPRQRGHRRARLAALTDAFERLVILVFEQRVVARHLFRIVAPVAAEEAQQPRL